MRDIANILPFRSDIASYLTHLTRDYYTGDVKSLAKDNLKSILTEEKLYADRSNDSTNISDARYGGYTSDMGTQEQLTYFSAVCFTETPLEEIHCLLEIKQRQIDLQPYGLVFRKESLLGKGVCPVLYLNNTTVRANGDISEPHPQDSVIEFLFGIMANPDAPENELEVARKLLPLVSSFGPYIKGPQQRQRRKDKKNFLWEREWRLPYVWSPMNFSRKDDVYVGLCPDGEIEEFEQEFSEVKFIDPRITLKWYADKIRTLIE